MWLLILSDDNYPGRDVRVKRPEDKYHAILETKSFAEELGFDKTQQSLIATVASELATNIARYADSGHISLRRVKQGSKVGIEMTARDAGPGIQDIEKALEDHYSTTPSSLGMGLSSLNRIMDDFTIESEVGVGTTIVAYKWSKV